MKEEEIEFDEYGCPGMGIGVIEGMPTLIDYTRWEVNLKKLQQEELIKLAKMRATKRLHEEYKWKIAAAKTVEESRSIIDEYHEKLKIINQSS